jgi:dienelactone hydrolase
MKSGFIASLLTAALIALSANNAVAAPNDLSDGASGRVEFQSINVPDMWQFARKNTSHTTPQTVWGDLLMPKNVNGKVPALVIMHGSAGVEPWAYDLWAARFNQAGVAVFVVDSYKPRGVSDTVVNQLGDKVTMPSQIADALNALRVLATHPKIDSNRIYVIGMSRGGNPAFYSAWPMYQAPVNTNGAKFAGHILMYPGMCNIRYRADADSNATAPIFFALADRNKEDWQDVSVCERYAKELEAAGNQVTVKEYEGAYHAWDGGGRRFRYENAQTAKACDMEVQMTDVQGGGVGRNAHDFKNNRDLKNYDEWFAAVRGCMSQTRAGVGGNYAQTDAVVADVMRFMGVR